MSLSREQWKSRLKEAEIDSDVVNTFVDGLSDDQLMRMKDATPQQIKDAVMGALNKCFTGADDSKQKEDGDDEEEDEEETTEDAAKKKEDDGSLGNLLEFANYIIAKTTENVVAKVKDMLESQEIEVEVPLLSDVQTEITSLKESFMSMGEQLKELVKTDTERIKDNVAGMSSNSRARLLRHFSTDAFEGVEKAMQRQKEKAEHQKAAGNLQPGDDGDDGAIIMDAEGNKFATMGEFVAGKPS